MRGFINTQFDRLIVWVSYLVGNVNMLHRLFLKISRLTKLHQPLFKPLSEPAGLTDFTIYTGARVWDFCW